MERTSPRQLVGSEALGHLFSLTTGRVGQLTIDYTVEAAAYTVAELTVRVFGHGTDAIRLNDRLVLSGTTSRGCIKTRLALEKAAAEVTSITEGRAAKTRGHMDCLEIVKDRAVATAIPMVKVYHLLAKITHEAAIGGVDQKQLETLMAHGPTPEQAVEMIGSGLHPTAGMAKPQGLEVDRDFGR